MADVAHGLREAGDVPVAKVEGAVRDVAEARAVPELLVVPAGAKVLGARARAVRCAGVARAKRGAREVALAPEELRHKQDVREELLVGRDMALVLEPEVEVPLLLRVVAPEAASEDVHGPVEVAVEVGEESADVA